VLPVSTLWGVLKQRSAPNKQKLKGGADPVPPLFFDGPAGSLKKETRRRGRVSSQELEGTGVYACSDLLCAPAH
jgi:hypothetical protein